MRQRRAGRRADRRGIRRLHRLHAGRRPPDLRRVLSPGRELPTKSCCPCHVCHPSLCNDNLVGHLGRGLPGQWLSHCRTAGFRTGSCSFRERSARSPGWRGTRIGCGAIRHGLVLTGLGGPGGLVYKRSRARRRRDRPRRRARAEASGRGCEVRDFIPYGYDERQYLLAGNQPGRRLPVAHAVRRVSRVPHVRGQSGLRQPPAAGGLVQGLSVDPERARGQRQLI